MNTQSEIFLKVVEKHKGIIFKIANSYCKNRDDRDDLVQEIIIQLWQSFSKYDNQHKYSTWIYRIALNTSISYYRKYKFRNEKTVEFSNLIQYNLEQEKPSEIDENIDLLQKHIRALKDIDKAIIILYLENKSQKEISKIIGITTTNVSTKITRIKKILKQKFELNKVK